jgi:hypothetical protein
MAGTHSGDTLTVGDWARAVTRLIRAEMPNVAIGEASPARIVWVHPSGKQAIVEIDESGTWLTDVDPARPGHGHRSWSDRRDERSVHVTAGNILGFFDIRYAIEKSPESRRLRW